MNVICLCLSRSQGKNCETALDACLSSPCANRGTCQVNDGEEGQYRCGSQAFEVVFISQELENDEGNDRVHSSQLHVSTGLRGPHLPNQH